MLKTVGWLYAIALITFGVLGFIPAASPGGYLLGIFKIDTVHNFIHLFSGIAFLISVLISTRTIKKTFLWFGIIYTLVLIIGMIQKDTVLGLFTVNMADHWLHALVSFPALWLGFRKE
jgi:hypothetical protein